LIDGFSPKSSSVNLFIHRFNKSLIPGADLGFDFIEGSSVAKVPKTSFPLYQSHLPPRPTQRQ
jgi:hypothetical protein